MVPDIYYQLLTVVAPCGAAAFLSCTRRRRARYIERSAAMYDLVPEFDSEHVMADVGRRPLLRFGKYLVVSQWPVAGFTTRRLRWSALTSLASQKISRTATSVTLFAAWVCYCCRVHGQWLPDMPNNHTYGDASLCFYTERTMVVL